MSAAPVEVKLIAGWAVLSDECAAHPQSSGEQAQAGGEVGPIDLSGVEVP